MRGTRFAVPALGAALAMAAACSDSTGANALIEDAEITADLAASSGDAVAVALETMLGNQTGSALPSVAGHDPGAHSVTAQRIRTCFDAAGAAVPDCQPMSSVRTIVTAGSLHGTRSGGRTRTGGETVNWTGAVHRTYVDTLTRNFDAAEPPAEVSRTHVGTGTANDTTTFTDASLSRRTVEAALDSIIGVTFNLPRSSNPWPVSGSVVRNVNVSVTATRGGETQTRSRTVRVQVTFPADAQGNVPIQVNDVTCSLNLVTRRVTNCT